MDENKEYEIVELDKERLTESVRVKVAAVVAAGLIVFNAVTGLIPELAVIELKPEVVSSITEIVTYVTVAVIIGRSLRNTPL